MLQATLNRQMVEDGRSRYWGNVTEKKDRGEESKTGYGKRLLSGSIIDFANAIRAWLLETEAKRASHRGAAYAPLKLLEPEIAAFIAARSLLDSIGLSKSYTASASLVGSFLEDEVRFAWLRKHHPGLFRKLDRQLSRSGNYERKRTVIVHTMNKHKVADPEGNVFVTWDDPMKAKVGALLIDLFRTSTGMVETVVIRSGRKTERLIQATAKTNEWIRNYHAHHELLDPIWMPMVEVPANWENPFHGGYGGAVSEGLPSTHLVKRVPASYVVETLSEAVMPDVYTAVNALQATPWKINQRVHSIAEHFWNMGRCVGGLPPSEDEPLPTKPLDITENAEARKVWKQKAARVHSANAALRSTRIHARKLLHLAQKFSNVPKFYFPYQLDFRGRVYAIPTFLNPQGSDLARSLLTFAEGVPIIDDTDAYWLAVYGANLFGKDKITFEDRVQWVADNRENILAVGKDPLANQWWQEAGEPWQFLAWCMEWTGWLTVGAGFVTRLPVCVDGTNNGLQILSMLTRDEIAAKATNVLPSDTPADIYGDVARNAVALMTAETDPEKKVHADYWLRFGIDRKTTKRPVMVLPYGGTFHSAREYVSDWYKDTAKARGEELPGFAACAGRVHYLSMKIWEAIEVSVGRPRTAMTWLQECADVFSKHNLPILWTAPSGFPVLQAYKESKETKVETVLGDCVQTLRLRSEHPTKLSKSRQKNGISPNYVHSCDAAALVKTIVLCRGYEIEHFAMIHDSYGTHAPRVHEMASALRTAFVSIFTPDCLNKLREEFLQRLASLGHPEAELPPVPPFGSLDVSALQNSEFFFA